MARGQGGAIETHGGLWGADLLAALSAGGAGLPAEARRKGEYRMPLEPPPAHASQRHT
jgi:hypothetical protein